MGKLSQSLFIGTIASTFVSGAVLAADLSPPPVSYFEPVIEQKFGGNLYLRGFVGFTNQEVDEFDPSRLAANPPARLEILHAEFESGGLVGGAVGYQFNQYFRADISAEYRMRTAFDGLDRFDISGDGTFDQTNDYSADKSEFVVLANAFVDLGQYEKISPYIGAGIGASYTTIHDLVDVNEVTTGVAFADSNGEWDLAWALYAGLGFEVNDHLTLDLGYRFLSIGDAESGDVDPFDGGSVVSPVLFNDIYSHDVTFGVRYAFNPFGGGLHSGFGDDDSYSYGQLSY
ncbi:MAG: outer membrane beta-barrel protein [Pseudomonadota bacterium]